MHNAQFGGRLGPFLDPASNQQVEGSVTGTFVFVCSGDPDAVLPQLRAGLLAAMSSVLGQKLQAQQVAIPTLQGSLPYFLQEIIAAAGAQQFGAQIQSVEVQTLNVANPTAVQAYGGPMPLNPMEATARAFEQRAAEKLDPRNYNVVAKVNVGGFKIKASSDGGLDTEGLKDQVKDKVKTEIIWYGIGCVIVGLVVIGLAVLGWYIYAEYKKGAALGASLDKPGSAGASAPVGAPKPATWDGKSEFTCGGSDNLVLDGVTAELKSGTAISALGNCHLTLTNVTIKAPNGISAGANAVVTMTGGSVDSSAVAAKALGNAQITFAGTSVKGKKMALGAAKITPP